ncbi:hypothetical protein INR49_010437 [Caranx melampygus]|nr:hypothetical protein INR49_021223 [Caranx melampygus]KAG7231733.1 hypothetical protein INR49_010437 [Caranx melampygus]
MGGGAYSALNGPIRGGVRQQQQRHELIRSQSDRSQSGPRGQTNCLRRRDAAMTADKSGAP